MFFFFLKARQSQSWRPQSVTGFKVTRMLCAFGHPKSHLPKAAELAELGTQKVDDCWPESEKGDCQAVPIKKIDKVQLQKGWWVLYK